MRKRILSSLLALCLALSLLSGTALAAAIPNDAFASEVASGTTGDLRWAITVDGLDYVLTISGTGDMDDFKGVGNDASPA